MTTTLPYGHPLAMRLQSHALFVAAQQRNSTINRLTGKLPTDQSDAESSIRQQSSNKYPIVVTKDLTKTAGDEVQIDLVNHINGKPIMGEQNAEGLGESISFAYDRFRINQTRKPISAGGTMSQQRTKWQLRSLAKALGQSYMEALEDQLTLVHLSGARGFHNNIEWKIPLSSDPDFNAICINRIKAPTKNRHYISKGTGLEPVGVTSGEVNIANTDTMNINVLDSLRALLDTMPLPPEPIMFDGDKLGADAPLRVLLVSGETYNSIVTSSNNAYRQFQADAMARASMVGNHPLFMGGGLLWNGILVVKMPKPIRFFAGSPIQYCADITSEIETTAAIPAALGAGFAVDRSILLGAQALGLAYGKNPKTGNPYFWSEKELDHDDKIEVLIGMVNGRSKIRFKIDYGENEQPTDSGVIAIDHAVPLAGV